MLFNSITYFFFISIVFILYWIVLKKSFKAQNLFLLVASYCFYGWWDVRFLTLIIASSAIDFFIGKAIYKSSYSKQRKNLLIISLISNLGILGFFKYYNFFIDSFSSLLSGFGLEANIQSLQIILPVGISFYTFQSLSYSIDIYRNRTKPTNDFISFMAFVSFFPQLVAGPIERADDLLPQFRKERKFKPDMISSGLRLILYGLFKKMVIADRASYFVDMVYSSNQHSGIVWILATFLFGIQIYCDFSGYSDIAVGSARLLGFDLMQNFKTPYFAQTLKEFWHRWHISLSSWFRDYIYVSMGGNRVSTARWIFNIIITFTLSGLWHGAALTFVIWGFLHGLFLIIERYISIFKSKLSGIIATFLIVNFSWIFFRAKSFDQLSCILSSLTNIQFGFIKHIRVQYNTNNDLREYLLSLMITFPIFLLFEFLIGKKDFNQIIINLNPLLRWILYVVFTLMIIIFGVVKSAPQFIYFQF